MEAGLLEDGVAVEEGVEPVRRSNKGWGWLLEVVCWETEGGGLESRARRLEELFLVEDGADLLVARGEGEFRPNGRGTARF